MSIVMINSAARSVKVEVANVKIATDTKSEAMEPVAAEPMEQVEDSEVNTEIVNTDTVSEDIAIEESLAEEVTAEVAVNYVGSVNEAAIKEAMGDNVSVEPIYDEGMSVDPGFDTGVAETKNPLLSSWVFVIGISIAVLCVSAALGAFLARRKIKKGNSPDGW